MLLIILFGLIQSDMTSEQRALDYFRENIYLDPQLYKNPCEDDDPDCLYLETIMPDKFVGELFLEDYTVFVKSNANRYPSNNSFPSTFVLELYGQEFYDRKVRIAKRVSELMMSYDDPSSLEPVTLIVKSPFISASNNFDQKNDKAVYLEVSKSIFTGHEYYVEIHIYTNYGGLFEYTDYFGYRLIFDTELNLIDWNEAF